MKRKTWKTKPIFLPKCEHCRKYLKDEKVVYKLHASLYCSKDCIAAQSRERAWDASDDYINERIDKAEKIDMEAMYGIR